MRKNLELALANNSKSMNMHEVYSLRNRIRRIDKNTIYCNNRERIFIKHLLNELFLISRYRSFNAVRGFDVSAIPRTSAFYSNWPVQNISNWIYFELVVVVMLENLMLWARVNVQQSKISHHWRFIHYISWCISVWRKVADKTTTTTTATNEKNPNALLVKWNIRWSTRILVFA